MIATENFGKVEIKNITELRQWLMENHKIEASFWLVTYKKVVSEKYVSTGEVLDELLCFGWIDGIRRKLDEKRTMQLISARKTQHWARTYKQRAEKLITEGRMEEPGFESIEASKANGLWHFMEDVDNLIIPEDLLKALKERAAALNFFENINDSSKRFVLRWLKLSKTETTRARRIDEIVRLSSQGKKLPGS
jgi:uncharacterized protein YdeI (YjbR/CyaY-like superfamily)